MTNISLENKLVKTLASKNCFREFDLKSKMFKENTVYGILNDNEYILLLKEIYNSKSIGGTGLFSVYKFLYKKQILYSGFYLNQIEIIS